MHSFPYSGRQRPTTPLAVILGTNEIASAVAVNLYRSGYFVVLSHDPLPPVIRRKMAFHDVLFDDPVTIVGVEAWRADNGLAILSRLGRSKDVIITDLGLLDLIVLRTLDILVDARMQKYQVTPDLRRLARFTIGLGPGFTAGTNCDSAIETRPSKVGRIIQQGSTDAADGISRRLGGSGAERFVYSPVPGRWHTPFEIGTRIFKDFIVGHLGGEVVRAPFDGMLRGVVRDGTEVPEGVKLLEVDPRGRKASWAGIDSRGKTIANAVTKAISIHTEAVTVQSRRALSLVK
jgi:xanthine dehydrogenase accessory factor